MVLLWSFYRFEQVPLQHDMIDTPRACKAFFLNPNFTDLNDRTGRRRLAKRQNA